MVAFWVNYLLQDPSNGWRYALGGQCVPALILLVGCFWMPRSPRWLVKQGLRVAQITDERSAQFEHLFRCHSKDGYLSAKGLQSVMEELGMPMTTVQLDDAVVEASVQGADVVDHAEFFKLMASKLKEDGEHWLQEAREVLLLL